MTLLHFFECRLCVDPETHRRARCIYAAEAPCPDPTYCPRKNVFGEAVKARWHEVETREVSDDVD